jgi:hypothetical protein
MRNSSRPSVKVPLRFSARITSQPGSQGSLLNGRSWSIVLTNHTLLSPAYLILDRH